MPPTVRQSESGVKSYECLNETLSRLCDGACDAHLRLCHGLVRRLAWLVPWSQEQADNIDAELAIVLSSLSLACKQISSLLQRSSIVHITGTQDTINIQGEDQKKLDVISNENKWEDGDYRIRGRRCTCGSVPNG
ncbi:Fructose-1,6-bisphosphatase, chloroplastic [Capsicum baccatum]|uniref:Fructose-1,6-bisphosphatase, chloroplastic n=1 Tax=Capsicum baccatum TaxID=33114 RepID=A0A2G2WAQ1_CAPBA|nr:Fructose-1,6-bisphosphatase, chloroplastic [Capsicum baccatum]